MRCRAIGFALLLSAWPQPIGAGQQFDKIARAIRQLIHDQQLPSLVVAVAKDGRIVWEEGFGWADRDRGIPATPQTP